jgi:hypothetical protein
MVQPKCKWESDSQIAGEIIFLVPPNAKDQPGHGIKYFAGWRRSKYFMPWSRMYPIAGRIISIIILT